MPPKTRARKLDVSNSSIVPKKRSHSEKTTSKHENDIDNSLINKRPKRVCRLPSKFDDHFISPSKFIPVQPSHASTPIANKANPATNTGKAPISRLNHEMQMLGQKKQTSIQTYITKASSDSNNNAKKKTLISDVEKRRKGKRSWNSISSPEKNKAGKYQSFKVMENKKKMPDMNESINLDVYEFTYDPNEEPPPQKKKRKRTAKKNPAKTKNIILNYDRNVAKSLALLKSRILKAKVNNVTSTTKAHTTMDKCINTEKHIINNIIHPPNNTTQNAIDSVNLTVNKTVLSTIADNHASVRIEDIAAQIESPEHEIDYSPVNSPHHSHDDITKNHPEPIHNNVDNNDPLNLQDGSFFDEQPVASSSINMTPKHPHATPWRVEFENLPMKWQVNAYVKPNMTPAMERSFVNFDDSKKKHVYTNICSEPNENVSLFIDNNTSLNQPKITSFIKEMRNNSEINNGALAKENSIFDDLSVASNDNDTSTKDISANKENRPDYATSKSKGTPLKKTPLKNKSNNCTFFGFDSDIQDQENVSPVKNVQNKAKIGLRSQSRAVLKEINGVERITRASIPSKTKITEQVESVQKDPIAAAKAPIFDDNVEIHTEATDINDVALNDDDSDLVHLFEDIEVMHHRKLNRKSYGKAKKVTFIQNATSDEDTQNNADDVDDAVSDEVFDPEDPIYTLHSTAQSKPFKKRMTKKQKLSKKEELEAETWAANFNSMCEDVEEFDLIVE